MPSNKSRAMGPRWLCCICCVFWQLPVPAILAAVLTGAAPAIVLALSPLFLISARHSLHILVTGRAPRSGLEMSMRMLGVFTKIRERQ